MKHPTKKFYRLFFYLGLLGLFSCSPEMPDEVAAQLEKLPAVLDFNIHVQPILSDKCFACHGPDENKLEAGLRLDIESLAKGNLPQNEGKKAIVSGSLKNSEVFHRTVSLDPESQMPPPESNLILSDYEKAVLIRWIEEGAEYKAHWAFTKPKLPEIPDVKKTELVKNPIDNFILSHLEKKDLSLAKEAQKEILLRRLSFDLTGLPPSIEEIDAFLNDESPNAYEKQVDRLLASPHYGERMAVEWMDIARFADTHGYQSDRFRDVSPWRDWVIKSFNDNLPFDEFLTWQLAGDLFENPTKDQLIATTFLRLHPQNEEGGIVEEEFRVEYVADRVNTVSTAFMGMTVSCAKCHNHKFDPISQKEYYQLFSFFNNVKEAGQISFDGAMPVPTMLLTDKKMDSTIAFIQDKIEGIEKEQAIQTKEAEKPFQNWLSTDSWKKKSSYPKSLVAHFKLDNNLLNSLNHAQKGKMARVNSPKEYPQYIESNHEKGLILDGDAWLDLSPIGRYNRMDAFSISLRVKIPDLIENGVIFHKGVGAALFNFKGYHLALKDNKLEALIACTAPYNAIIKHSKIEIPRDKWINLCLSYDGSSRADGLRIFLNGYELETVVETDNLYKDIAISYGGAPVGLQIGARWRGKGIGGAHVDDIMVFNEAIPTIEILQIANPDAWEKLARKTNQELSTIEKVWLKEVYLKHHNSNFQKKQKNLKEWRIKLNESVEPVSELMIMQEMETLRPAFVLNRGQYDEPGEEVFPGTPKEILAMPANLEANRLGLAKWLLHADHPLLSRVIVNRYWQQYFGIGLVKTSEDFGVQGERPSHPALLDWLAIQFRELNWDIKAFQKLIVLSATYRQSSLVSEQFRKVDPENLLYGRGSSKRLSAEMLRDNALAASGLLNRTIGGPSVYPYQPEGLWKVNNRNYPESQGTDLYRRSLYTIWKRSVPHPTQATFDAPDRSECSMRRQETNTPLQALVLMNDPLFVEASNALAKDNDLNQIFRKLTGRQAKKEELDLLEDMIEKESQKLASRSSDSLEGVNANAYARVVSTILNLDATLVKR